MNDNINIQQTKFTPEKKAVISLIFGIGSITPILLIMFSIIGIPLIAGSWSIYRYGDLISRLVNFATAPSTLIISLGSGIIGLTLGIIGLKSIKRNFAIAGIILSLIGLIIPIIYFIL